MSLKWQMFINDMELDIFPKFCYLDRILLADEQTMPFKTKPSVIVQG